MDAGNHMRRDTRANFGCTALPQAVGPLSATVLDILRSRPALHGRPMEVPLCEADPYGLDLQLTLYVCYELHYRGFDGVNPRWEWNPALLHLRGRLEEMFHPGAAALQGQRVVGTGAPCHTHRHTGVVVGRGARPN
jgi:hypothetical protein